MPKTKTVDSEAVTVLEEGMPTTLELAACMNNPGLYAADGALVAQYEYGPFGDWGSSAPRDRGGYVYYPGHSMAGGVTSLQTGKVALRSYGSMSCGGLLSYIYARLSKEDPPVVAVKDWHRSNYPIEENPGMGQKGCFYDLHLLTKALTGSGEDRLELASGAGVLWRDQVAVRMLKFQKADGS